MIARRWRCPIAVARWLANSRLCTPVLVLLGLLTLPASADPVVIEVHGGAAQPCFDEADIRMISEDLTVSILPQEAVVDASFTFVNEGTDDKQVLVGFPQLRYAQTPNAKLEDFSFKVGDETLPFSLLDPEISSFDGMPLPEVQTWYVARVVFRAEEVVNMTVHYAHKHGGGVYGPYFTYLLATAAGWKGNVETIRITLTMTEETPELNPDRIYPKNYDLEDSRRTVAWTLEDYKGKPEKLFVYWRRPPRKGQPAP